MKIAVLTVMYAEMATFLEEYITCIKDQTFKDFELVVISDQFPMPIKPYMKEAGVNGEVFEYSQSPLKNRLHGLKMCRELGYDIIICSDSDETMCPDRIEKIVAFFSEHPGKEIVYNNSIGVSGDKHFDLFYKDRITLFDIVDFNVLGYGAMNIKTSLVPFICSHQNENVSVFDWWLALVYLLYCESVDFLRGVKNNYRMHPGNFIGPVFDVAEGCVRKGICVKKEIYSELIQYCRQHFPDKQEIFA